ncbi:T9SS type A sorting domain-containing protein [Winogradskyella aquimaris]
MQQGRIEMGTNLIDVENYQAGVYFLRLENPKGQLIRKIIKE